ncbi:hypothetical protein, partial [Mesorhizobium sp. CA4]|uniref:hypothetical protein n=1 Tax=Mesorhizobium sp. CA4 TaxID=588499 RepID=UPI001CD17537
PSTPATEAGASAAKTTPRRLRAKVGHELRASTSAADASIRTFAHNVRFDLASEIAYQAIREQYFARLNRVLTGVQVFLGTSAAAAMLSWVPGLAVWLVSASALAGVLLLVMDPAGAARDHRALRSRLQMIRAGLEEHTDTEESLRRARAGVIRICADAPPGYRAAQAIAFNNAVNAFYDEKAASQHRYKIGFWRGLLANVFPMRGHRFAKEQTLPHRIDNGSDGSDLVSH